MTDLQWIREEPARPNPANEETLSAIRTAIRERRKADLLAALKTWDPLDVMQMMTRMRLKYARKLFQWLPANPSVRVIAELKPDFRALLMQESTQQQLTDILDGMDPEDAAETLNSFPDDIAEVLLDNLPDASGVAEAAAYSHDTGGRVMARRFVAVPETLSVEEAVAEIRSEADRIRKIFTIYVVDDEGRLVGTVGVGPLLLAQKDQTLGDIMGTDVVAVSADTDQEEVLRIARNRDMRTVPVIDGDGRLIGRITPKQLNRIAVEEASEDMMFMSGVSPESEADDSILRIVKGRLPWLLAGLVGASVAASVVGIFEDQLAAAIVLASFIPITMSLAGNAGLQASAVAVRGLATGKVWEGDIVWRLLKELAAALINGAVAGLVLGVLVLTASLFITIEDPLHLVLATSLSLLCVTTLAAMVGATIPILLDKLGFDPAMAIGVFITSSNDVLGVLIFFLMATTFYLG